MQHRHDEFALSIRWRKPNAGSYPRPSVPGFYLQAGWANEGEADWLQDMRRLSSPELGDILTAVGNAVNDPRFAVAAATMINGRSRAEREELARLTAARDRLDDQIQALSP